MPAALEDRTNLPPQVTTYFVRNGVALMPPFRKTEVSDADLRDIAAYLDRKR
jgi:mono/diheme cytochrome c family protein